MLSLHLPAVFFLLLRTCVLSRVCVWEQDEPSCSEHLECSVHNWFVYSQMFNTSVCWAFVACTRDTALKLDHKNPVFHGFCILTKEAKHIVWLECEVVIQLKRWSQRMPEWDKRDQGSIRRQERGHYCLSSEKEKGAGWAALDARVCREWGLLVRLEEHPEPGVTIFGKILGSTWLITRSLTFVFYIVFVWCVCAACMYMCIQEYCGLYSCAYLCLYRRRPEIEVWHLPVISVHTVRSVTEPSPC